PAAVLVNLAHDLTALGELALAEQLLRAGQERFPDDFWLNHDLGIALVQRKPPDANQAVGFLRAALALRPRNPGVYLNLGGALRDQGDVEGAIRCFHAALALDPKYVEAHGHLGSVLYARKDLDGAIRSFQVALDINPNFAGAHNYLGMALKDQ